MKTAWFLIHPEAASCSFMPVYHRFGSSFLEKWLERSLQWQKQALRELVCEDSSFFVVVRADDLRVAQIRKTFAQKPALPVKMEFAAPDSFERRAGAIFQKYGPRFDRIVVFNSESPLLVPDDFRKLQTGELDAIETPSGRPLVLTGSPSAKKVKVLPGLYDLRSISDILQELSSGRHEFYTEISAGVGATFQEITRG